MLTKLKNYITRLIKGVDIDEHKRFIAQYLPENPIVVEAGAHVGYDTTLMHYLWKKGRIYAFEPIPAIYDQLKYNTRKFSNVTCIPYALSEKTGKSVIHISKGQQNASSSLLEPKEHLNSHPDIVFEEKITIDTFTIDDWAKQHQIPKVDFMWLDMQGMELQTLKASPNILKTVKIIHTEVHYIENYAGVPLVGEVKSWFASQGFDILKELPENDEYGDITFIRK